MAGRRPPHIELTQLYLPSAGEVIESDLPLCAVGPCFEVQTKKSSGTDYDGTETGAIEFNPDNAGVQMDYDAASICPVTIYISNTKDSETYELDDEVTIDKNADEFVVAANISRNIYLGTTGVVSGIKFTDVNATFKTSEIMVGDWVDLGGTADYKVLKVVSETELTLQYAPGDTSGVSYSIDRKLAGPILMSYRAFRTDLSGSLLNVTLENLEDTLGVVSACNPLAYACYKGFYNTRRTIKAMALGGTFDSSDDTKMDWASAITLIGKKVAYGIVPLSQNNTIRDLFITHINDASDKYNKKWRLLLWSQTQQEEEETILDNGMGTISDDEFTVTVYGDQSDLGDVEEGDYLVIETSEYLIVSIADPVITVSGNISETGLQTFDIERHRSLDDIAGNIRDIAKTLHNMRVILVEPDVVKDNDVDETEIPGYYLCAAIGGQISFYSAAKPFSRLPIYGFSGVVGTNDYFDTEEQLNVMAEGGVYIVIQTTEGAPLECREQLTTFPEEDKKGQLSIVKAVDKGSYMFVTALAPYVGRYNITPGLLMSLGMAVGGVKNFLVASAPPIAGSKTKIVSVEQDETNKTHINIAIIWDPLYPGNVFKVVITI